MIDESIIGMIAMVHVYKSVKGDNDQPGASVYKRLKRGMMIIMVQVYKSDEGDDGYYSGACRCESNNVQPGASVQELRGR